jgi:hypothetical protein
MNAQNQFLLYTAPNGAVKVEVFIKDETVWLTQKALAELFGVQVPAVNKHLKNIFDSGELVREATISKMEIVRAEGNRQIAREVEFYNLDAILRSVTGLTASKPRSSAFGRQKYCGSSSSRALRWMTSGSPMKKQLRFNPNYYRITL